MSTPKRTAIITGANKGLGFAMSEKLASMNYTVIMACRDPKKGETAYKKLKNKGMDVVLKIADVGKVDDIENLFKDISKTYDVIDILINNAAINVENPSVRIESINLATLTEIMNINVIGTLWMCKMFLPLIKKSDSGRIVNFTSGLGQLTHPRTAPYPSYSISKTAVNAITKILADELADTKVIVNSVDPGWIKTDMGGPEAPLPIEEGIDTAIWLATEDPDKLKSGYFYKERKIVEW